jgi:hypothetical protein
MKQCKSITYRSEALLKVPNGAQYAAKSGHRENRQPGAIPCPMGAAAELNG